LYTVMVGFFAGGATELLRTAAVVSEITASDAARARICVERFFIPGLI
jgi:hypothetical protein